MASSNVTCPSRRRPIVNGTRAGNVCSFGDVGPTAKSNSRSVPVRSSRYDPGASVAVQPAGRSRTSEMSPDTMAPSRTTGPTIRRPSA